jgi:dihydrofolate reductase
MIYLYSKEPTENLMGFKTWEEAMEYLSKLKEQDVINDVWITGGSHIYKVNAV